MLKKNSTCKVTMVFYPVSNKEKIARHTFDLLEMKNGRDLNKAVRILKPIADSLVLKDWGEHDVDEECETPVPMMDADLFNDFDDDWKQIAEEDDVKSFADVFNMDMETFTEWMKNYWAVSIPIDIETLKINLNIK